jgi:PiT family inorganic phosphate transporter
MSLLILTSLLAFYLAWNLGANDLANSMGTAVGSKTISLRQALIIAGILELAGALLFGQAVSTTLASKIVDPTLFAAIPHTFILGMIAVAITCGLWLNLATLWGLPVSSSHAVVGAIAGFAWVATGIEGIAWQSISWITFIWVITPIVSGAIAALVYANLRHWILDRPDSLLYLQEWIPWLSALLFSSFGVLVFPSLAAPIQTILPLPTHTIAIGIGAIATFALTVWSLSHDQQPVETQFIRFQLLSSCFVAFAHGSNDVGNAIAPLAASVYTHRTGLVPASQFILPLWVLLLGSVGIVAGLAVWGKRVITTVGEGIISLQPSAGFCAQLGAALTVLLASGLGLPVSTSHAIVGGVVGIGFIQGLKTLRWQTLQQIVLVWFVTIPAAIGFSALIFTGLNLLHL